MDIRSPVLAILCGGAPAPGINGVISSVTIEALNSGCNVIGIFEGFKQLKEGRSMIQDLEWNDVTQIYNKGGSILRTSKQQITNRQEEDNCLRVLQHHRVRYLVTIGGAQTAYSVNCIANAAKQARYPLQVVHVPKTIFNDLPLPTDCRTFGYSTAREEGMYLVQNFTNDARTLLRWYILVVMGQRAGHLAMGIGKAGAATLTLIPEDFQASGRPVSFQGLASVIEGSIYKRRAMNKEYGIVVLSEGLVDCLNKNELQERFGNADNGHQEIGRHLVLELQQRFKNRQLDVTVVARNIGNELRSADPNASDILLTRDLGYAAVRFLLDGGNSAMITMKGGSLHPIPLSESIDASSSSALIRPVDTTQLDYQIAQSYMIKLWSTDLQDVSTLTKLARAANMTTNEFTEHFQEIAFRSKTPTILAHFPANRPAPDSPILLSKIAGSAAPTPHHGVTGTESPFANLRVSVSDTAAWNAD